MKKYLIAFAVLQSFIGITQEKKETTALRITSNIKINGQLDESIWETITAATGFKMLRPDNGPEAPSKYKTEVKVLYDDKTIYIGAILYDNDASAISREFSQRDNVFVEAYVFTVAINTFNDGINENKFYVTAAGTQADSKTRQGGRRTNDYNWSAVWESAVNITDIGWVVEIKIPYSALRFQNTDVQTWGINFIREIKRRDEIYSWNYIDRSIGNESQYNGILNGITNIKPPIRLSFFPFVSAFSETSEGNTKTKLTAGLDLKYGITENFTLDATVIPDFSQTGFDPLSLNLGPFEQTFREQRQFFTEGVE
ncbi:MAG: carbohydrate binding family 9 domain-containing protein, partial [Bacteroidetes bacterium]|nr:carbohydrate binding family 9 domain-containing protein [Bacteroidota bacterium]